MDKMCKNSKAENSSEIMTNSEECQSTKRCESPVFKFINQVKPIRGSNTDSSVYDIPSYQLNQSGKSCTSSKLGETSETGLPSSPIFSPILVPTSQFQPPSIHSLGTVAKNLCKFSANDKPVGVFESLGMNNRDISWVSSMASPPPKNVPGSQFNTVEKATFLPEEKFQSIQPRALFSPAMDEDIGCHPITSESDEDDAYKSSIRLSDVCATLKKLEFKSLDLDCPVKKITPEDSMPAVRAKKKLGNLKKKKGVLVMSPDNYEFSVGTSLKISGTAKSGDTFIEDDSFQTMSFTCIDELCKTMDQSNSSLEKTTITSKPLLKKFYSTKASTEVYAVTSMDDLHSYAKALEEGDKTVPEGGKIDPAHVDKGIIRFDVLEKNLSEKEIKADEDNSEWEKVKQYLSESQLNVSDSEIFRTLENLEKTLVSQENKDMEKLSGDAGQGEEPATLESTNNSKPPVENSVADQKEPDISRACQDMPFGAFTTASGLKISVSEIALKKAREILKDCEEEVDTKFDSETVKKAVKPELKMEKLMFSTASGNQIQVSSEALKKAQALMSECDEDAKKLVGREMSGFMTGLGKPTKVSAEAVQKAKTLMSEERSIGFSTGSGKRIEVSAEALEKAKTLMSEERSIGFSTGSGKRIEVSAEALEKAKTLISEERSIGFSTGSGKRIEVSAEALEKAKAFMKACDDNNQTKGKVIWSKCESSKAAVTIEPPKEDIILWNKPENRTCGSVSEVLNETKLPASGFNDTDNWDEIIPDWLHVYNTSPSIACDRVDFSPVVSYEDGKSLELEREYVIKSPVLGSGDRFFRRRKRGKIQSKVTERKTSVKRTLDLDFSAPFKRMKFVDDVDVRVGRKRARETQEKHIGEKKKIKPVLGSHLGRKTSEKKISWLEAVAGASPEVHSDEDLKKMGVLDDVLKICFENAVSVRFKGEDFFGLESRSNTTGLQTGDNCLLILDDDNQFGMDEVKRAFLSSPGVQPNLLPIGWVENHYKWIVWKLAHYERSFPQYFAGKALTPNNILTQLKYRYDREIDRNERSAIRKILERDDSSIKRLVLCVCAIRKVSEDYELELTDGWYSCPARSDPAMTRLIEEGKLSVGTKLVTQGASLVNCDQGVSPLERSSEVYLKIATNSTRRIRWDVKLGFQRNPENFPTSLGSILAQGGPVSRIDVIIVRIYPMLYMEKTLDGHHVTRNRKSEEKADAEFRRIQEQNFEMICSEVQQEAGSESQRTENDREMAEKIENKLKTLTKRNVSEFLRAKIVDLRKPDYNNPALLSIWNPNEELLSLLSEGKAVSLLNVSARIYKSLQINTTRQTHYKEIKKVVKYPARKLTVLKDVPSKVCPVFEEVDLVGMVALIQDVSYGSRMSQVVYLTDLEMNFVSVVFWGSCKDYGWENTLKVQSIVACSNLQWKKSRNPQDVPSVYVNENSVFTENPRQDYLREEIERLKRITPKDITLFLSTCEEEITNKLEDSKWRTNTSKNSSNDSTFKTRQLTNGFESKPTASSTPIKPFSAGRAPKNPDEAEPSPIQRKIEKLQTYGEPPSLIPLIVRNNIKRKYRKKS